MKSVHWSAVGNSLSWILENSALTMVFPSKDVNSSISSKPGFLHISVVQVHLTYDFLLHLLFRYNWHSEVPWVNQLWQLPGTHLEIPHSNKDVEHFHLIRKFSHDPFQSVYSLPWQELFWFLSSQITFAYFEMYKLNHIVFILLCLESCS